MKTVKFILICFMVLCAIVIYAQPYQFPVRPGDEAWKKFQTMDEMYQASQIPGDLLSKMRTADLVTTCMNYPLINSLYAYNDLQEGFNSLRKKFNGFEELLNRPDAGNELIKAYGKMVPDGFDPSWSLEKKGLFTFRFSYMETLLAQKEVQARLPLNVRKELTAICLTKYERKQNHIDIYGTQGTSNTIWVVARTIQTKANPGKKSNQGYELAKYAFVEQGVVTDSRVIDEVVSNARDFIK